ncbi:MAG: DEAD/DEAH box helicase family protein, partial [Anaerolineales bacterium]|nr:DEAD/DEAH box helicase family protein [Anaerolineales bacterium]
VIDEFESLIRPTSPVSEEITQITGITQAMVNDAPTLFKVRSQIRKIIGDHVIVGHNVGFDVGFLQSENLALHNETIDTVTLASVILPSAGRYNLESLAHFLQLPLDESGQAHRAMADVLLTAELLLALREITLRQLDVGTLSEIVEAGSRVGWREALFFDDVLKDAVKIAFKSKNPPKRDGKRLKELFKPERIDGKQLTPKEKVELLPEQEILGMFGPNGNFARQFEGFEVRPQQVDMVAAVVEAFNHGRHLLIEAGTGTGKSMGYLLPAAFWAAQNGRRVVISTNTINLQDQLVQKDIPQLQKILPFEFRATVRKGRRNYLCTRLFQQMRHKGPSTSEEMTLYARMLVWLPTTQTGDRAELSLRSFEERMMSDKMSAENDICTPDMCTQNRCPRYIAQRRADNAHVIIVNHALLLSDLANENHILPEFVDLIVDEAHHLEVAVTNGLSFEADKRFLERTIGDVIRARSGLLDEVTGRTNIVAPDHRSTLDGLVNKVRQSAELAVSRIDEFFGTLSYFLNDFTSGRGQFAQQIRLTTAVRSQPLFDEVMISWDNLHKPLYQIIKNLKTIAEAIIQLSEQYEIDDVELMVQMLATALRGLEETRHNIHGIIADPTEDFIYWAEVFRDKLSLHAAPLHVGPLVEEYIFHAKETVVLTSATMRTAPAFGEDEPNFDYIRQRLHASDAYEMALGSPFDYPASTLLYLVSDIPEPNQPGYDRYVAQAIIDTAATLGGRTLALFTSYSHLRTITDMVREPLRQEGVTVLAQHEGASRQQITDQFKTPGARAVLLGTRSFWEGVDIPGESLQAVMLVKIPFDVPSDPVFAARSETFDNSFFQYSIPEAILRWRQGFGRLIRRQTDEGVVIVLDKRVLSKRYGQAFTDSLLACTTIRQPAARLNELLIRWFNRER